MTPLPTAVDASAIGLVGWRIDVRKHAASWDSGIGAEVAGGRWNPKGVKAVYCSLDPATCIIEVAVHTGFKVLDTQPHVLTSFDVSADATLLVVRPDDVPNPAWLHGGTPSAHQQAFGADLLSRHDFVIFPSAVSKRSWNLVFSPDAAGSRYAMRAQEALAVDTRLNPPAP
ncbi:MAG TPA: RES domain-containing protein [Burkholderiaceae bacterium]|nr:RES domain-containing protein [Burkholderiaceae bacterium]